MNSVIGSVNVIRSVNAVLRFCLIAQITRFYSGKAATQPDKSAFDEV